MPGVRCLLPFISVVVSYGTGATLSLNHGSTLFIREDRGNGDEEDEGDEGADGSNHDGTFQIDRGVTLMSKPLSSASRLPRPSHSLLEDVLQGLVIRTYVSSKTVK